MTKSSGSEPQGYRNTTQDETNTFQIAGSGRWKTDRAVLSTDFAYSGSKCNRYNYSLDFLTQGAKTVDVAFVKDGGVAFNFPSRDPFNPNDYIFRGYYEEIYRVKGAGWQWRGDPALDTDLDFLPKLQFGLRATQRHSELITRGSRYAELSAALVPHADLPMRGSRARRPGCTR